MAYHYTGPYSHSCVSGETFINQHFRKRKYNTLSNGEKALLSESHRKRLMMNETALDAFDLMQTYKMKELKEIAKLNHVDKSKIGNKTIKRNWAEAIISSKKFGFNSFVISIMKEKRHPLHGQVDMILMIQDYLKK